MSADPNQMAQILALYKKMYPGGLPQAQAYSQAQQPMQTAQALGNAPTGTNTGAGGTNALAKLMLALLQKKKMQEYQAQYGQPQGVTMTGGGSAPTATGIGGDIGVPTQ